MAHVGVTAPSRKPLEKRKGVVNVDAYHDLMRIKAGLRPRTPLPPALRFLHTKKPKPKPPAPRPASAAGAAQPKTGGAPQPRPYPGVGSLKFTVIGGPPRTEPTGGLSRTAPTDDDEFLDIPKGPNSAAAAAWWNGLNETMRIYWMGWSRSADPMRAFEAYKTAEAAVAARQAEDARAAERCHAEIVAKALAAKAAAQDAASRSGANGAGTQH